jgi:ABC-type polysaccharide/polyol phosphate export permease
VSTTPAADDADRHAWHGPDAPLLEALRESFRNPAFWGYSTWLDIVTRYRKSTFGLLWMLVPPSLYIFGMGYFFAKIQNMDPYRFMPHLGLGYLLFRLISMVMIESTSVLPQHAGYILDGRVRLTDFVLKVLVRALFYLGSSLPVLLPVVVLSPDVSVVGALLALGGLVLTLLNLMWLAGVVSLFGARFPDTHEFMGSVFVLGFVVTPILWYAKAAPAGTLHGAVMRLNPAFHLIEVVRAPLLGEPVEPLSLAVVVIGAVLGWALWIWAYRRFTRYVALWV